MHVAHNATITNLCLICLFDKCKKQVSIFDIKITYNQCDVPTVKEAQNFHGLKIDFAMGYQSQSVPIFLSFKLYKMNAIRRKSQKFTLDKIIFMYHNLAHTMLFIHF